MGWVALGLAMWVVYLMRLLYKTEVCLGGCYLDMSDELIRMLREARDMEIENHGRHAVCGSLLVCEEQWDEIVKRHFRLMRKRGIQIEEDYKWRMHEIGA